MSDNNNSDNNNIDPISFSVDAGLIDRLGRELVGRAETAVSELVKNSYDADARNVEINFINSDHAGGTLEIKDDGLGMTLNQLKKGFMTISSTDKIHHPKSERYGRNKAGRKGIGRFATHHLGEKLTIVTQTLESTKAIKLTIEWSNYKIDTDLTSIENEVELIDKTQDEGTIITIDNLREGWTHSEIKRVYRYVADLLQPDYISERSKIANTAISNKENESFNVRFFLEQNGLKAIIADPQKMIFEKALAVIEGYIDNTGDGFCSVESKHLDLGSSDLILIFPNEKKKILKFDLVRNIHFKVYYFIYDRESYYTDISKVELNSIKKIANEQGGIKVYRNGFRVLPYGEPQNDWLGLDRGYVYTSGVLNIPFANRNMFGYVEILDLENEKVFEETASREGLIEDPAYKELYTFIQQALGAARKRISSAVQKIKDNEKKKNQFFDDSSTPIEKLNELQNQFNEIIRNGDFKEYQDQQNKIRLYVEQLKLDFQNLLDELGMLRVLAGLGLTVAEFSHEVVQLTPALFGDLFVLESQSLNQGGKQSLENLKETIDLFTSYTSFFNSTVSANVSRELKPLDLELIVNKFGEIVKADKQKINIELLIEVYGHQIITRPMHISEWNSILYNLYTNAKKAIHRKNVDGKIKIVLGKENDIIYLEFADNGDGIPEENKKRVFDAFFTTSTPAGFDTPLDDAITGTGLGLKIVKDIIQTYKGSIDLIEPETGYNTCFRIELSPATKTQKNEYDL